MLDVAAGKLWRRVQHETLGPCLMLAMSSVEPALADVLLSIGVHKWQRAPA